MEIRKWSRFHSGGTWQSHCRSFRAAILCSLLYLEVSQSLVKEVGTSLNLLGPSQTSIRWGAYRWHLKKGGSD